MVTWSSRASRVRFGSALLYLPALLVLVLVLVAWQFLVIALAIPSYILPSPASVAIFLVSGTINWAQNGWVTFYEAMSGFTMAVVVGIPIAMALASSTIVRRALYPLVLLVQTIPKVAIAPILFLILGFGDFPRVITTFLVAFFPVIIDTYAGLDSLDVGHIRIMRSMHASGWQIFLKAKIPNAMPQMFSGFKVALTLAFVGAIVAEFVQSSSGLGYVLLVSLQQSGLVTAFSAITVLSVISAASYGVLLVAERLSIPWYARSHMAT